MVFKCTLEEDTADKNPTQETDIRVQGSGFEVEGLGFRVQELRCSVKG